MATFYKNSNYLLKSDNAIFDALHRPGANTPHSGIYRCEGCGAGIASNFGNPLPPQNHHQHVGAQGDILWRLIVWA